MRLEFCANKRHHIRFLIVLLTEYKPTYLLHISDRQKKAEMWYNICDKYIIPSVLPFTATEIHHLIYFSKKPYELL